MPGADRCDSIQERARKAVGGRAINKDLATLSAFFARAVGKRWMASNPLTNAPDERVKVKRIPVEYLPDGDLRALIAAAQAAWLRAFIIVAYYTGARRGDLLLLEWESDVDLVGSKGAPEGRTGPHAFVRGSKADTAQWRPLHSAAVAALEVLRRQPVIDEKDFPVRGSKNPAARISQLFADTGIKAGLTETVRRDGTTVTKNKWTLHDLRRKANTDLRNSGASPKERMTLLGHRTAAVNQEHHEAVLPWRERELIDGLSSFGMTA